MEERIKTLVADTIATIQQGGGKIVGTVDAQYIARRVNESLEALRAFHPNVSPSRAKRILNIAGNSKTGESFNLPALATCPTGARLAKVEGTVCSRCYARKGRFIFANVIQSTIATYAIVEAVLRDDTLRGAYVATWKAYAKGRRMIRLHGSGDVYSTQYWALLKEIAAACGGTLFWLPTKETLVASDRAIPDNLIVRYSMAKVNAPSDVASDGELISIVVDAVDYDYSGTFRCPATFNPTWQGTCNDCRACADRSKRVIVYRRH